MTTEFEYGSATGPVPELRHEIERKWPGHQTWIHYTFKAHKMYDWKVRFFPDQKATPGSRGSGLLVRGTNLMLIGNHSRREMVATVHHEILHLEHPEWDESRVEEATPYPTNPLTIPQASE